MARKESGMVVQILSTFFMLMHVPMCLLIFLLLNKPCAIFTLSNHSLVSVLNPIVFTLNKAASEHG